MCGSCFYCITIQCDIINMNFGGVHDKTTHDHNPSLTKCLSFYKQNCLQTVRSSHSLHMKFLYATLTNYRQITIKITIGVCLGGVLFLYDYALHCNMSDTIKSVKTGHFFLSNLSACLLTSRCTNVAAVKVIVICYHGLFYVASVCEKPLCDT